MFFWHSKARHCNMKAAGAVLGVIPRVETRIGAV
jgi:hypothetical protein